MDIWILLSDIVLLLAACLVFGGVFSRLGQSPLVGYLLAGMVLGGPGSLHLVRAEHEIENIAELGVSLLLFSLGLEFSVSRLRSLGPVPLVGGVLQVVLSLAASAAAAMAFGSEMREAVAIGAMVALSSTTVVLRTLMDRQELETPYGSNSLAVLLVQDIAVVPLAILITLLAGGEDPAQMMINVGRVVGVATALVLGLYILLNFVAYYALGTLELARNRELTILLSVVTGLGSAWAAHKAGISPALGAFVAGMFLGSSPFATQVRADVSPLRIVLLTLFFGSAGMVADPMWIANNFLLLVLTITAYLFLKFVVITAIFVVLGTLVETAVTTALCLAQIGEFAFVLGRVAHESQVLSDEIYNLFISATIISLFLSPYLVSHARVVSRFLVGFLPKRFHSVPEEEGSQTVYPDVVIVGFGPAGQIAGALAHERGLVTSVIDINRSNIAKANELGMLGHVGDAGTVEVLEHSHASHARAVIVTLPSKRASITVADLIREIAPQAHIIVRSRHQRDCQEILASGADVVFDDEQEVGQQIGNHLCSWIETLREQQNATILFDPDEEANASEGDDRSHS